MQFLHYNLEIEYNNLDERVKHIVAVVRGLMNAQCHKEVMVTSVWRCNHRSPHYWYRAVDIRSTDLADRDAEHLCATINHLFPYNRRGYSTCLWHDVGRGRHFHIQVKPKRK